MRCIRICGAALLAAGMARAASGDAAPPPESREVAGAAAPADAGTDAGTDALRAELTQLLERRPNADDFLSHASILRFEAARDGLHHTLVVEVPLAALRTADAGAAPAGQVQILARLKDRDGRIVHTLTFDRTFSPATAADGPARRLVCTSHVHLPTGRYMLESLARDPNADAVSVRRVAFDSPETVPGVRMSNVTLLQSAGGWSARDESRGEDDPLLLQGQPLTPILQLRTAAGPDAKVEFFTIVYPDRTSTDPLAVHLELVRDGLIVGESTAPVPPADERGEIRYAGALPLRDLPPGEYSLRVRAEQGTGSATEEVSFTVVASGAAPAASEALPSPA